MAGTCRSRNERQRQPNQAAVYVKSAVGIRQRSVAWNIDRPRWGCCGVCEGKKEIGGRWRSVRLQPPLNIRMTRSLERVCVYNLLLTSGQDRRGERAATTSLNCCHAERVPLKLMPHKRFHCLILSQPQLVVRFGGGAVAVFGADPEFALVAAGEH